MWLVLTLSGAGKKIALNGPIMQTHVLFQDLVQRCLFQGDDPAPPRPFVSVSCLSYIVVISRSSRRLLAGTLSLN